MKFLLLIVISLLGEILCGAAATADFDEILPEVFILVCIQGHNFYSNSFKNENADR
jgi:hypothetical protein